MAGDEREQRLEDATPPPTRIGDLTAILRVMQPLNDSMKDAASGRRQLLADLCRFIGVKVGTVPVETLGAPSTGPGVEPAGGELSPRLEQTLKHLLDGHSEKQVARKLELSQHTVHVYVKTLYRRFGVTSRAELLAKHLRR